MAGEIGQFYVALGIKGADQMAAGLANMRAAMAGLAQGASGAGAGLDVLDAGLKKTTASAKQSIDVLGQVKQGLLQGLGMGAGFGLAQLTMQATRLAIALPATGARAQELGDAFRTVVPAADAMLASLKAASGGTIAEMDMMLAANRAAMLGLGTNAEQMGQLMEVARFRARVMGLDTSQALDRLVTGLGRMSPLILDDLGLVFDSATEYANYAASIGKAATALTDAEKKQSLMSATIRTGGAQIKAAGGMVDSTADSFRKLQATIDDTKVSLGKFAVGPLVTIADKLKDATTTGGQMVAMLHGLAAQSRAYLAGATDAEGMEAYALAVREAAINLGLLKAVNYLPMILKDDAAAIVRATTASVWDLTAAEASAAAMAASIADNWSDVLKNASAAADNMWGAYYAGQANRLSGQALGMGVSDPSTQYRIDAVDFVNEAEKARIKENRASESAATKQWLSDRQAAAQQMQSTLEGMFTATSGIDVTGMRDQMGDHVQTWDEDRRRMLAVAQGGLANEWAKTFAIPEEVLKGGDKAVRAWALDMVKAFDEGAPSATAAGMKYDVGAVVQQYKDMAANKALQKQLAQEAAKQLGSEGITVDTGIMAQISGQAEGITTADVLGKDPFKGIGVTAIDVFKAELTGQAEEIAKAGAGFMGVFIDAAKKAGKESEFMTNMMNTLIPGLLAELQRRGLLRGPAGAYP